MMEPKQFSGTLAFGQATFEVHFEAQAKEDARLQITVQSVPLETALSLYDAMGEPGTSVQELSLTGSNAEGEKFFSNSVNVDRVRTGTHECSIGVSMREAKVSGSLKEPTLGALSRLWFRGFKSCLNPPLKTALGTVEVHGSMKGVATDDVSGFVVVRGEPETDLADWFEKTDEFLSFMHRGLCFASGKRLQTPLLETYTDKRWEATFYSGKGFDSGFAPIHFLNQGPFIEALANRFDNKMPFPDILWTAIGLLHVDTSFNEVRLLMSMIALEAIVEHMGSKDLTTVMPKEDFVKIRDNLLKALSDTHLEDHDSRKIFTNKIKQLNSRTLAQKVQSLRDQYALSKHQFTDEEIVDATQSRNAIAHQEKSKAKKKLWPKILFVRDLVSQIVFHEIGYIGPHESYQKGYKKDFKDQINEFIHPNG